MALDLVQEVGDVGVGLRGLLRVLLVLINVVIIIDSKRLTSNGDSSLK